MSTKKDLFYFINNVYAKNMAYPEPEETQPMNWVVNRFLSLEPDLLDAIACVSKYMWRLGHRYYRLLWRLVPKSSPPRHKYLKTEYDLPKDLVERWQKVFKLSRRETEQNIRVLQQKYSSAALYNYIGLEEPKDKEKKK